MTNLTHPRAARRPRAAWHKALLGYVVAAGVAAACSGAPAAPTSAPTNGPTAAPTVAPANTSAAAASATPAAGGPVEVQPIAGGPVLLRGDMTLRKILSLQSGAVKLVLNPVDGKLYFLRPNAGIYRVTLGDKPKAELVSAASNLDGNPAGLAIGPDGKLYTVANKPVGANTTQATVRRGTPKPTGTGYTWDTLATTEPYPLSHTNYDHLYNGITVSPDGQFVFVNAGSRTDHGEEENNGGAFPGLREAPLTARLFRLPIDAVDLVLPNDEAALAALNVVYATGTRNAFDLEFAPNGELFAIDNGPDSDYPDELNWIRPGLHFGFPWRFGSFNNPQQFPDYNPSADKHLQSGFAAVDSGTYQNDPNYPPAPAAMTDPIANLGPAAAQYRGDDGSQRDAAAEGNPLLTFTPHRTPLGLVFATSDTLPTDLQPSEGQLSAFILSWGAAAGTLSDTGRDLLHMALTPTGDSYQSVTVQIARDFKNPIDAVLIGNQLYVLEFGEGASLWEITFH